jgi:hypothetical protein
MDFALNLLRCCSCWVVESAILLLLILTRFSRRNCIFMLFDEQRHLVRHFRVNVCPFCRIFKAVCLPSYLLESRFSLAYCRAVCFSALVIIFSLLDAVSLYYRDIFSVAKDKNQTDLPEVKLATIFVHA